MKENQFKGQESRVMYIEIRTEIHRWHYTMARIGWVKFSKSGKSVYYRDRMLLRGQGVKGNHFDEETGEDLLGFRN